MNNLDQIQWIFDGRKSPDNFRSNMETAIDNLPIDITTANKFNFSSDVKLKNELKSRFDEIFRLAE